MKKLLPTAVIAASLIGCASVPVGDPRQDAALKTFSVPANGAGVYIYRNESMGAAVRMDVEVDGKIVGQTAANTYLYKEVAPGRHTITSKAENTDSVEIVAKPATLSFIWQEVKMGVLYARTKLNLVGEAEGKRGVLETRLAESK